MGGEQSIHTIEACARRSAHGVACMSSSHSCFDGGTYELGSWAVPCQLGSVSMILHAVPRLKAASMDHA